MPADVTDAKEFAGSLLVSDDDGMGIRDMVVRTFFDDTRSSSAANDIHSPSVSVFVEAHTHHQQHPSASVSSATTTARPGRKSIPTQLVDHTYRDFSQYKRDTTSGIRDEFDQGKKLDSNFPAKLHKILSNQEYSHIICWMPHGRSWQIVNKDLLMDVVCSKYFSHTKYQSFIRQVNGWGFKQLHKSGLDYKTYYHECLLRGLPHLTRLMKRMGANKGKLIRHKEGEPNFYGISRSFPLPLHEGAPLRMAEPPLPHGHAGYIVTPPYQHGVERREEWAPLPLIPATCTTSAGYRPTPGTQEGQYSSGQLAPTSGYPPKHAYPPPTYYNTSTSMGYYSSYATYGSPSMSSM